MKRQNQLQRMTEEEKRLEAEKFWSANNQEYFKPTTVAIILQKSLDWLQKKRCEGDGIKYIKTGHKSVSYQKQDVLDYMDRQKQIHTGG